VAIVESRAPVGASAPASRRARAAEVVRRTDAFVIYGGIMLLMLITTLDVGDFFDRPSGIGRYTILILPFGAALWVRARKPSWVIQRPVLGHALVGLLVFLGVGGSVFGMAFRNTSQAPFNVFVPMGVGLILLLAADGPTDREVGRTLHLLGLIGLLYVFMNFLVNTHILTGITSHLGPLGSPRLQEVLATTLKYRNASAAVVALAFACAIVERRWRRLALLIVLYAGIFAGYPSATQVLIACGTVLTLLLTSRKASSLRTLVTASLVVLIAAAALLNLNAVLRITSSYFAEVGKVDANNGRLDLAAAGLDEFKQSPIVGQVFTTQAVAERLRDGKTLPFHDDFVLFLAEGGILGIGLLFSWMVYTEITLLRRYREFMSAGNLERARLTRVLLVMLNAFFIAIPFNPVMEGVTRTATLFGVWAIAMSLGRPERGPSELEALI
jgi:hypothetical protein